MSSALFAVALQALVSSPAPMPQPSNILPSTEITAGAIGTDQSMYALANHQHPRITRSAIVTTDAGGNWSVTWSAALPAAPITLPLPINGGSNPALCNVTTSTTTGATGRCWMSAPVTVSILGFSVNVFGGSASGMSVQVLGIPTTQ